MKDILGNEINVGDWLIIAGNTDGRRLELGKIVEINDSFIKCESFVKETYKKSPCYEKFIKNWRKYRKINLKHLTSAPADFIKIEFEKIKNSLCARAG